MIKKIILNSTAYFIIALTYMPLLGDNITNNTYKLTIITSLFKGAPYIDYFMKDIVRQTIFDQCNLIIINANSPDRAYEDAAIAPYLEQYPNITYVHLAKDPGLFGVWNIGIKMAQSPYITNANIDDALKPNCYETHTAYLDTHPEIDLVYSGCYITHVANETFENNSSGGKIVWHSMQPFNRVKQLYNWIPYVNNHPVWRRSLHKQYGLFNESYRATGGMEFWVRATLCGHAQYHLIPEVYSLYYHNPKGISTNPTSLDKIEKKQVIETFKHLYEYYFNTIEYLES